MSETYRIAETDTFSEKIKSDKFKRKYSKIINYVYPQLRTNPFYGPNIKKLKGDYSGIYRYRIGDYRLFYTVDPEKYIVFILTIDYRKNSYKKK